MTPDILKKFKPSKTALEGLKELARYILSAVVGALLTWLARQLPYLKGLMDSPGVYGLIALVVAAVYRGVDKYLHERGKETGDDNLIRGLTRF